MIGLIVIIILVMALLAYPGEGTYLDRLRWALTVVTEPIEEATPDPSTPIIPATSVAKKSPTPRKAAARDWYEIYFTHPTCPPEANRHGGLDEIVIKDLLTARKQVDIAMYDLSEESIVDVLINLHEKKGAVIRVVTDSDNEDMSQIHKLRRHGISVVTDKRSGIMHDKFVIIDNNKVWTGSLNLTSRGVYCNNNNFVRFNHVPQLVANYRAEMDEMYVQRLFGPKSPDNTPYEDFTFKNTHISNYFSPERSVIPEIARTIAAAEDEVLIMAFSFTNRTLGEAALGRAETGVSIRAIFESLGSDADTSYFGQIQRDRYANVKVRRHISNGIMHHKVIIIDRKTVIFGSYNFTESADSKNDENIIIVHDPNFASYFLKEFERRWKESKTAAPR